MLGPSTTSRTGWVLWPLGVGALVLGFGQTLEPQFSSVIGWTNSSWPWEFLNALVEAAGWLLIALTVWRVAQTQQRAMHPWGDSRGIEIAAVGAAVAALNGLIHVGLAVIGGVGPFTGEGDVIGRLFQAELGITAASQCLIAVGALISWRAAVGPEATTFKWARSWFIAFVGTAAIAFGSGIAFLVWVFDSSWYQAWLSYALVGITAVGWLVVALSIERFCREARGAMPSAGESAFHLGAIAAAAFALGPIAYTIGVHEIADNFLGPPTSPFLLRWSGVATLVGWLCIALAALISREHEIYDGRVDPHPRGSGTVVRVPDST